VPERAVNPEEADQRKRTEFKNTALKRYLGSHPEYDYVFVEWSGGPTIGALSALLGRKFSRGWAIDTVADLERDATIPREVVNAIEQKVLEVLPWIRHVRVTDPEGTDIEFSLSRKQARLWRMGAYEGNHLRMYPPQATGGLYEAFGIKDVVIPEADGVIGGTNGHSSALMVPGIRVRVESGAVVNVEGGGLQGLLMNDIRKKYQDYQIPFVPHPGWLFVYHGSMHVNPKEGTANIHWGFGVDIHIPEVQEYAEKYGIPLTHCFHVDNRFPTYEATVVGGRKIRIIDKGHLFALDDPEVRAIASKYGDPDDILRAEGAEPIPGVNAPGDYWKDYGQDAADYLAKQREELRSGKSPYLFSVLPMQLRMMLTGSGNRE
jgi:hypothetical protein